MRWTPYRGYSYIVMCISLLLHIIPSLRSASHINWDTRWNPVLNKVYHTTQEFQEMNFINLSGKSACLCTSVSNKYEEVCFTSIWWPLYKLCLLTCLIGFVVCISIQARWLAAHWTNNWMPRYFWFILVNMICDSKTNQILEMVLWAFVYADDGDGT